jgi:predicted Holliday junction resolvase-like endonuclease
MCSDKKGEQLKKINEQARAEAFKRERLVVIGQVVSAITLFVESLYELVPLAQ